MSSRETPVKTTALRCVRWGDHGIRTLAANSVLNQVGFSQRPQLVRVAPTICVHDFRSPAGILEGKGLNPF
jgi:hypothetical protein